MAKNPKKYSSKKTVSTNRNLGKNEIKKEPEFYHKHKNTIWTIVVLILLAIFFIVNNTREVSESGPYPSNYNENKIPDKINY